MVQGINSLVEDFDEVRDEVRDVKRVIEVYLGLSGKLPYRPIDKE